MTLKRLSPLLILALSGGACAEPLRVVTFSAVLTEIASEVGGPEVSVTGLEGPGVDPHTFEPAPVDLRKLAQADLVLASGLGLEQDLARLAAHSGTRARILEAGSALGDLIIYREAGGRREPDPHWWNSIPAVLRVERRVAAEYRALRPAAAAAFTARSDACAARLEALDRWAREQFSGLPPARRRLVTSHDAFAWFARDYGFTVHPVSGMSPESEPNARDFASLILFIRRERIPAIFVESSVNPDLAEAVTRETGARLGGELYADGLSPDADGATYERMFRHNVRTIAEALR